MLRKLGFDDKELGETKKSGLKEKFMPSMKQYMIDVGDQTKNKYQADTFEQKSELKGCTFKEEDNMDWKFVQIIPAPKKEAKSAELVLIESLPKYCHQAFGSTKALNLV